MSQTVNGLDTSMTYTITYSIAGAPNGASSQTCYVYVFKDSQTNVNLLVENIVSMGADGLSWMQYLFDFTPTVSSHLILFLPEYTKTEYIVDFDDFQFLELANGVRRTFFTSIKYHV
jgi:hypothetical protein